MQEVFRQPTDRAAGELVSCLCVTGDRPAFIPWLLWNYRKQDHPLRELVIIDGSNSGLSAPEDPDIRIVPCSAGANIAEKRNLALDQAAGSLVAWFDDDDWQHPRRLSHLAEHLVDGSAVAGSSTSWFVDLDRLRARSYDGRRRPIFNGALFRRAAIGNTRFATDRVRATDTTWLSQVLADCVQRPSLTPMLTAFWLCHSANISNPSSRLTFPHTLRDVAGTVTADDWGNTESELIALQQRLSDLAESRSKLADTPVRSSATRSRVAFPAHQARVR